MVVVAILVWIAAFAKQAKSQNNKRLPSGFDYLAYLDQNQKSTLYRDSEAERVAHENWTKEEQKKKAVARSKTQSLGYNPCSCVSTARYFTGINVGPIGLAKNHPINTDIPQVGAIGVTTESLSGHLVAILQITDTRIFVKEGNYIRCQIGTRWLNRNDPVIRGYYIKI